MYLQELSPASYSVKECIAHAVDQVLPFWLMAGSKRLVNNMLKKNQKRLSDAGGKRKFFTEKLDKLWDIVSPEAVEVIEKSRFLTEEKKKEDIAFYEDQKHDKVSSMIGEDKVLHGQLLQQQIRQQRNTAALYTFDEMKVSSVELSEDESLSMALRSNSASSSSTEFEDKDSQSAAPAREIIFTASRNIMDNNEIAAALDRLKISDNSATMIISSFIRACNGDVNDFCLSRSTTRRSRIASRFKISLEVLKKNEAKCTSKHYITLGWKINNRSIGVKV